MHFRKLAHLLMSDNKNKIFSIHQIIIPIFIGIAAIIWLFAEDVKDIDFSQIVFSWKTTAALAFAIISIIGREYGYMLRYRHLTNYDLSWKQAFRVTMLCEFSSTITPSSVGGSSLAMIFMNREGIEAGRGTTIVLITLFLDELFFVISCPIVYLLIPTDLLFGTISESLSSGLIWTFWSIYILIALWTAILFIGIFYKPHYITKLLLAIFKIPILSKWRNKIEEFCDGIIRASVETRNKKLTWWTKPFLATVLSWTSRYILVNAIFAGLLSNCDHLLIFARQAVVWLMLLVTPTPGGSGVSEWLFSNYYADMVTFLGMAILIAMIWRIFSYYLYLLIGISVIPSWLNKKKHIKK